MVRQSAACLALSLLAGGADASSYEDWYAPRVRRPFLTRTALLQAEERLQASGRVRADRLGTARRTVIEALMEYGVSGRAQLSLEVPYASMDGPGGSASGVGDVTAGVLSHLRPVGDPAFFAGILDARLPTGEEERGLGSGETVWRAGVLMSRRWRSSELHVNASQFLGGEEGGGFRVDAALVLARGRWRPLVELTGLGGAGNDKFLTPGCMYETWGDVEWGVGFPIGLVGGAPKDGVVFKVTRGFGG